MFGNNNPPKHYRKYVAGALIAGVAAGFFLINSRK
jgi:hypothetical protein